MRSAMNRITSFIGVFNVRYNLNRSSLRRLSSLNTSNSCRWDRFLKEHDQNSSQFQFEKNVQLQEIIVNCDEFSWFCLFS